MKNLLFIVLLVAVIITAGCVGGNQNSVVTPTPQIIYVTVTVTPTTPPIITPTTSTLVSSSLSPVAATRIPVVPATSIGNEPSVAVKAKYSTANGAQSFAIQQASQHGITQAPVQITRPLIHAYTNEQDSRLDLTNKDTAPHEYYVELNFYAGDVQLISSDGQLANNGIAWYVSPGQTVRGEVIPPESATSYVIKTVAIVTRDGLYDIDYDLNTK